MNNNKRFTVISSDDPEVVEMPGHLVERVNEAMEQFKVSGYSGIMMDPEEFKGSKILIKVCGVGGGGGNAVNRMIDLGMNEVDFIAINTDAQALSVSKAPIRLQIGAKLTGGLGAGSIPSTGLAAADSDREHIREVLDGAHMVFITAGMGGGTGTGAVPIVAEVAKEIGALTVAVVTLPFAFEGPRRMKDAREGVEKLRKFVDALIVIPNDRVITLGDVSVRDAFLKVDEVLHNGIRAVTDLIKIPQLINIDFADLRTTLQSSGRAHLGIGIARGEKRAEESITNAVQCNLLENSNISGAKSAILCLHGGSDMKIEEIIIAGNKLKEKLGEETHLIFGVMIENEPLDFMKATVIAAGFPEKNCNEDGVAHHAVNSNLNVSTTKEVSATNKIEVKSGTEKTTASQTQHSNISVNGCDGENCTNELFPQEELTVKKPVSEQPTDSKPTLSHVPTWFRQYVQNKK